MFIQKWNVRTNFVQYNSISLYNFKLLKLYVVLKRVADQYTIF